MEKSRKFDDLLKSRWTELFETTKGLNPFVSDLKHILSRDLGKGLVAFFNESWISKKRGTQMDFAEGKKTKEPVDKKPVVYKEFDESKFNFNKVTEEENLFYLNLEDETLLDRDQATNLDADDVLNEKELDVEITKAALHPIVVNNAPACRYHCVLPLFPEEELPQVIGDEIITFILQVFKFTSSPSLRIGFNSIGGNSSVNHLHFQLIYAEELFKNAVFPIETYPTKPFLKTSLQNPGEEINMYSVGVVIEEMADYPIRCFVLTPADESADEGDIHQSLGFVAGTITNMLLDKVIPHNLIFANRGRKIYLAPRKFELEAKEEMINSAFLEVGGLAVVRSKEYYDKLTHVELTATLKRDVSLEDSAFETIKKEVAALFKKYQ